MWLLLWSNFLMLPLAAWNPMSSRGFCDLACGYFLTMLPTILLTLLQPLWPHRCSLRVEGMPLLPFDVCPGYSSAWMLFANTCITNSCTSLNFYFKCSPSSETTYLNQLPISPYPTFFPMALFTSCHHLEFTSAVYCLSSCRLWLHKRRDLLSSFHTRISQSI